MMGGNTIFFIIWFVCIGIGLFIGNTTGDWGSTVGWGVGGLIGGFILGAISDPIIDDYYQSKNEQAKIYNQEHAFEIAKKHFSDIEWYRRYFYIRKYIGLGGPNNYIDHPACSEAMDNTKYLNGYHSESEKEDLVIYLLRGNDRFIDDYLIEYEKNNHVILTEEEKEKLKRIISVKNQDKYKRLISEIKHNKELAQEEFEKERQRKEKEKKKAERAAKQIVGFSKQTKQPQSRKSRTRNPKRIICLDVETTDKSPGTAEILQLSIIDFDNNVLFNHYIKPDKAKSWPGAEAINKISPKMVSNEHTIDYYRDELEKIFEEADLIVAYNGDTYDIPIIARYGFDIKNKRSYDVMLEFAPIYGEWDSYHDSYTWQKLITCAEYYGYHGHNYHDSLEDIRATLFCYKKMTKAESNEEILKSGIERTIK